MATVYHPSGTPFWDRSVSIAEATPAPGERMIWLPEAPVWPVA